MEGLLLADLLQPLVQSQALADLPSLPGMPYYRYADNIVYLCRSVSAGSQALAHLRQLLEKHQLTLIGFALILLQLDHGAGLLFAACTILALVLMKL
jgi:hypothetical protein